MYLNYQRISADSLEVVLAIATIPERIGLGAATQHRARIQIPQYYKGISPVSDLVVLISAVLASLTSGLLIAYGVCLAFFRLFRTRARQPEVRASVPVAHSAGMAEAEG